MSWSESESEGSSSSSDGEDIFNPWECRKRSRSSAGVHNSLPWIIKRRKIPPRVEDGYAKEVGRRRLFQEKRPAFPSLPGALFHLQLGLPPQCHTQIRDICEREIGRAIIKSRAPDAEIPSKPSNCLLKPPKNAEKSKTVIPRGLPWRKWCRTEMFTSSSDSIAAKQQCDLVGDFIILKDPSTNTRRFFRLFLPWARNNSGLLDSEEGRNKWNDIDVFFNTLPQLTCDGINKVSNTLFVLKNRKLLLFDFSTGEKLEELDLAFSNESTLYNAISVDNEKNRVYVASGVQQKPKAVKNGYAEVDFEYLIFAYPPLVLKYRILIPRNSPFLEFRIYKRFCTFCSDNKLELFDLKDVIKKNVNLTSNDEKYPLMKTVVVYDKPEPLTTLPTRDGYFEVIPHTSPPLFCVKRRNTYQIINPMYPNYVVHEFPNTSAVDCVLSFLSYDLTRARFIIWGFGFGFEIYEADSLRSLVTVSKIFSTEEIMEKKLFPASKLQNGDEDSPSGGRGVRQSALQCLVNLSKYSKGRTFGFDYNEKLDLIAVCCVCDGVLSVMLYDNPSLKVFKRLQPVNIIVPKNRFDKITCLSTTVLFRQSFVTVLVELKNGSLTSKELYTLSTVVEEIRAQ